MLTAAQAVPVSVSAHAPGSRGPMPGTEAVALHALLDRARDFGPGAAQGVVLRAEAAKLTARLAAAGRIPAHLRVRPDEPLVVVVRTLAAVARIVSTSGKGPTR